MKGKDYSRVRQNLQENPVSAAAVVALSSSETVDWPTAIGREAQIEAPIEGRERPRFVRPFGRHKPTTFLTSLRGSLPPFDGMRFAMCLTSPRKIFEALTSGD